MTQRFKVAVAAGWAVADFVISITYICPIVFFLLFAKNYEG